MVAVNQLYLEAISVEFGFNPKDASRNFNFNTYLSHSNLNEFLSLGKRFVRPKDGYFLRAESYYNVTTNIEELDKIPALIPPISASYRGDLYKCSHEESFFALLSNPQVVMDCIFSMNQKLHYHQFDQCLCCAKWTS